MRDCLLFVWGLVLWLSGLVFNFVAKFPAKMVLAGNLVLSADIFPRQSGFGGLFQHKSNYHTVPLRMSFPTYSPKP